MRNCPGISWGYDAHINLMRSSKGWLAVYYDAPGAPPEIIRVFTPRNYFDYSKMMTAMTEFNYNTCLLCPIVKMDMDYTA